MRKVYYSSLNEGTVSAVVVEDSGPMLLLRITAISKRFWRRGTLVAAPRTAVVSR